MTQASTVEVTLTIPTPPDGYEVQWGIPKKGIYFLAVDNEWVESNIDYVSMYRIIARKKWSLADMAEKWDGTPFAVRMSDGSKAWVVAYDPGDTELAWLVVTKGRINWWCHRYGSWASGTTNGPSVVSLWSE